jgi:hypothetical protein
MNSNQTAAIKKITNFSKEDYLSTLLYNSRFEEVFFIFKELSNKKRLINNNFEKDSSEHILYTELIKNKELEIVSNLLSSKVNLNSCIPVDYIVSDETLRSIIPKDQNIVKFMRKKLKNDPDVFKELIYRHNVSTELIVAPFIDDKDVAIFTLSLPNNGLALTHFSQRLQDDKDCVMAACFSNVEAFKFASDRLKQDIAFIEHLIVKHSLGGIFNYCHNDIRNNREIALLAVQHDGNTFGYIFSEQFKSDKQIVLTATRNGGFNAISYANPQLLQDDELIYALLDHLITHTNFNTNLQSSNLSNNKNICNNSLFEQAIKTLCKNSALEEIARSTILDPQNRHLGSQPLYQQINANYQAYVLNNKMKDSPKSPTKTLKF